MNNGSNSLSFVRVCTICTWNMFGSCIKPILNFSHLDNFPSSCSSATDMFSCIYLLFRSLCSVVQNLNRNVLSFTNRIENRNCSKKQKFSNCKMVFVENNNSKQIAHQQLIDFKFKKVCISRLNYNFYFHVTIPTSIAQLDYPIRQSLHYMQNSECQLDADVNHYRNQKIL